MDEWHDFFLAQAGAAGVLTRLVFVGVSINLPKIVSEPGSGLPGRAAEALVVLVAVLTASSLLLVPGQAPVIVGAEVLMVGLAAWVGSWLSNCRCLGAGRRCAPICAVLSWFVWRWVRSPRYRWWWQASLCWQAGWEVYTGLWRAWSSRSSWR
jgi:hypothetical protein